MPKTDYLLSTEIEVGQPLRLDLPLGRSATVQRFGSAVRVAIGRSVKRAGGAAVAPIANFFVSVDIIEAITAAMCEAAALPALPRPEIKRGRPRRSEGPRCPETGYAFSTAYVHHRCRCAACLAWRRGGQGSAGASPPPPDESPASEAPRAE